MHTPGPWSARWFGNQIIVYYGPSETQQTLFITETGPNKGQLNPADSSLIAAAPDLLAALEGMMEIAEEAMPASYFQSDSRVNASRAAIARAKP